MLRHQIMAFSAIVTILASSAILQLVNFDKFRNFLEFWQYWGILALLVILCKFLQSGEVRGIILAIFWEVIVWKGISGLFGRFDILRNLTYLIVHKAKLQLSLLKWTFEASTTRLIFIFSIWILCHLKINFLTISKI